MEQRGLVDEWNCSKGDRRENMERIREEYGDNNKGIVIESRLEGI